MVEDGSHGSQVPHFLREKSERAVKRELRGILQSYHHYWDILAELLQNSRDAIERRQRAQRTAGEAVIPGRIRVVLDATARAIEVTDNGTGIAPSFVAEVLAPGGGDKSPGGDEVGEKGVGLTYVAFSGDDFRLATRHAEGETGCNLTGASSWVSVDDAYAAAPKFQLAPEVGTLPIDFEDGPFTCIRISGIPSRSAVDLFSLSSDELKWVLRTRTAVGDTRNILRGEPLPNVSVSYNWTSVDGTPIGGPIDLGYPILVGGGALKIEDVNSNLVGKNRCGSAEVPHGKGCGW